MPEHENGWNEYSKLVLSELQRLDSDIKRLETKVDTMVESVAALQIKSGIWGFAAGFIPSIGVLIYMVIDK